MLTNKDRSCEQSEPRSYPVVEQARSVYKKISFFQEQVKEELAGTRGFFRAQEGINL